MRSVERKGHRTVQLSDHSSNYGSSGNDSVCEVYRRKESIMATRADRNR